MCRTGRRKVEEEGGINSPGLLSRLFSSLFLSLPLDVSVLLLVLGRLFLQLLWRAEGLVDVGRKLLHLVVHQQVLRDADRKLEMNAETGNIYSALAATLKKKICFKLFGARILKQKSKVGIIHWYIWG